MIYVPSRMGQLNRRALLRQLQKLDVASRADLAKALGMSQPTAGKIVDELIAAGVLEETGVFDTGGAESSLRGRPLPKGFLAFGEVGLAGEVRPAPRGQERLKEAAKLGFSVAIVPKANAPKKAIEGLTIHAVERVEQAIEIVRGLG